MDKISHKSLKVSKKKELNLEKKVKSLINKEKLSNKNIDKSLLKNEIDLNLEEIKAVVNDEEKINNEIKTTGNEIPMNFNKTDLVPNKHIVIVKNINITSKIDDVLSIINYKNGILKHNCLKIRNRGVKSQMLTIEFKSAGPTDGIIKKVNGIDLDGNILTAEYKYNPVESNHRECDIKTDTFIIKNLPLSYNKDSVKELVKDFNVSAKNIQITKKFGKNCCFIKFNSEKESIEAYEILLNKDVEGLPLNIKFVSVKKEKNESEFTKTKLHITNLPFSVKKEDIEKEFDMAQSIKFPLTPTGKSKGSCYLTFPSEEMAALAFESFQDKFIGDRKIKCCYAEVNVITEKESLQDKKRTRTKKGNQITPGTVITLFNLPTDVTQKEIISNFTDVKLVNFIKKDAKFKGIAEVHFKNTTSASLGMAVPEFTVKGRVVRKELKGVNPKKSLKSTKSDEVSLKSKDKDEPMEC